MSAINSDGDQSLLEKDRKQLVEANKKKTEAKQPLGLKILSCFDVYKNYNKFFEIKDGPLAFLNGIRSLSLFYVIWAHEYFIRSNNVANIQGILDVMQQPMGLVTVAGIFAVDVFFWLSGFLLAFVILEPSKIRLFFPFNLI